MCCTHDETNNYWDDLDWSPLYYRYNKLSSGASATKTVLSDAGSRTATAAKNVGSATAKKLGEIRYHNHFNTSISLIILWNIMQFQKISIPPQKGF